ncbi:uncharacterized protein BDR25DRAFT_328588 [Lindgomyces ingoldianus]|uniref:Uncharacterized protein n=1 Tax=Lindgomyces ingoldianus TaxID=673940 RepID=A0ACB6QEY8_9PLEO|nr:uncharacterized protein BDR25DRAFT_328588 [Lindgomyces ingoldianus]KAF2465559.1 hypothetical protein BDR25DRAFT_328588 [Lindgomyces ingoldianus]
MESDESQLLYNTPQPTPSFKRPRRSLQSSTPLNSVSESASPSPRLSSQAQLTPEVIDHINGLKHLDDKQIFLLLEAARNGDRMRLPDRSSMSTLGSRSSYLSVPSSRVTSIMSDPRSSIASTDTSYSSYSAASSRLSTASSRLSTISNTSSKNFACTFCDKALKSKPYWKSHEEEFHEQRLTWRCPDCEQIFHAGKRFREHHTKLHGCENCKQPRESGQPTSRKASPCVKKYEIVMHDKDAWGCGFCSSLLTSWEERCEHIALHFEEKRSKWNFTNVVLGLLKQSDVSQAWNMLLSQRHGEQQNWPQFTWESKKCNRLRYKLETKWDTRVFDIAKLVLETYELAEMERTEAPEPAEATEPIECKTETFDFGSEQTSQLTTDHTLMDLDPVETPQPTPQQNLQQHQVLQQQNIPQQSIPQTQWPVTTDMSQNGLTTDDGMDTFGGFSTNMTSASMTNVTNGFTHAVSQSFHQPSWPHAGFVSTPDLVAFQQPGAYMNYTQKEVVHNPAYDQFNQFPRNSMPPNFLHHSSSTSSRRFIPKLINISSPRHGAQPQDQPPPPPPKDDHSSHRFSKISMRRRPSNISQHTVVSQRDLGWNDEYNWG